jgi:hypothetical protein
MNDAKYIGLDVHQATISAAVLDSPKRPLLCIHGLRGDLHVTFEEGTCAAWLREPLP